MKARRLIVRDTNGAQLAADNHGRPIKHFQIDLTDVAHTNAQAPIAVVVQEECNLGCWHDVSTTGLPCWGAE